MKTDVLIVGAGPTGLALANQFVRYGVDFRIVDKKASTSPYSKAIGVQARTLEIYDQIGIADDLIARGWKAEKVRLIEGGEVRAEVPLEDIGRGMSEFPFLLIVEQGEHEALLYDRLRSHGRQVEWRTDLEEFSQDADTVTALLRTESGENETVEARYLVGCDGAHSPVRNALGLTFEGSTLERLFYVADVEIDWPYGHDALHVCLAKNTVTAFFPMKGDRRWRIVGTFPEAHEADESDVLYDEIERQILHDTELELDITKVHWFSAYKVHSRHVNRFSRGRCFLAGDSAHIHTPAGAQGMNTGIQDGYNLAWKLAMVLRGETDAALLDTYNEERLPNAERLLETTDRFFEFGASDDRIISFFRTQIFPFLAGIVLNLDVVRRAIFPIVSQIGINYRESSLSGGGKEFRVKPGDRMPYFVVDGSSVYDRLQEPAFHLLVFSDGSETYEVETWNERIVRTLTIPLYPAVAEIFGTSRTFTVLLRPDNYIAFIGQGYSPEELKDYMKRNIHA